MVLSDQKGDAAKDRRNDTGASLAGTLEQALHGQRALAPEERVELADNLATHRLFAEHRAGNRRGDQQDRRDCKQRVIRQRRTQPERVIVPPGAGGAAKQPQDDHHIFSILVTLPRSYSIVNAGATPARATVAVEKRP
jgi:hypothetical protein